jgi:CheY-like chemotaxis protein
MSVPLPPVLVVDDEKNMRLSLQTVLKDEGYAARAVESAEEALELLAREDFFMVITDARLGGMSGYDFLARTRNRRPSSPSKPSRPARLTTSPSRLRPRNCSTPCHGAPNATGSCGKTPRCARAPVKRSRSTRLSANRRGCWNCEN